MSPGKPEILAPAGSAEALAAAIGAGADAVYFGLTDFNARIRARNFELGDLPGVLTDLRRWGIRSYVAFNTLVFREELAAARDALEAIAAAGPDGIIVQDLGILRLARRVAPHLPLHASTQMTVASAGGVRLVAGLGASRVILARELTLAEIARIRREVETELEVFVHGALCVSYSGQCLSSEDWGGRSANRGQCAQACRLPYDLFVDGRRHDLDDRAYLLSPRDLEGFRRIPELIDLGISAFKIEGRMKSAEYVAAATALYRAAVDRAWGTRSTSAPPEPGAGRNAGAGTEAATMNAIAAAGARDERRPSLIDFAREARQVFSRGSSEGFLGGVNHQVLVDGTARAHRGVRVGTVARVEADREGRDAALIMDEQRPEPGERPIRLKPGDGILVAISAREEDEAGGRVLSVEAAGKPHELRIRFPRESRPDLSAVVPGTPVYRTSDPELLARLRRAIAHPGENRRVTLRARIEGEAGAPLKLTLIDPDGREVTASSEMPCAPARHRALDVSSARELLDRFGGTRYRLGEVTVAGGGCFVPVSEINRLRRVLVGRIEEVRGAAVREGILVPGSVATPGLAGECLAENSPIVWAVERAEDGVADAGGVPRVEAPENRNVTDPGLSEAFEDRCLLLCRVLDQVRAGIDEGAGRFVLDFLDLRGLKDAVAEVRRSGRRVTLALPRVQKAGEERIESFFLGLRPDEILVRSLGGLERLAAGRRHGSRLPRAGGAPALRQDIAAPLRDEPAIRSLPAIVGDVSLNAVNPDSIEVLLGFGLARIAPGLDLNGEQLESLVTCVDAARLEIPLYHHLPVFHTEHCVFAAFLSDGADFRTCGRPCDRHRLELRDRTGHSHPVVADVGCRNTVFGARPQSTLAHLRALRAAGVRDFRLELISEDAAATRRLIALHREVWTGRRDWREALRILHAESVYGVSLGAPERPRPAAARPAGTRAKPAGRGLERSTVSRRRPSAGRDLAARTSGRRNPEDRDETDSKRTSRRHRQADRQETARAAGNRIGFARESGKRRGPIRKGDGGHGPARGPAAGGVRRSDRRRDAKRTGGRRGERPSSRPRGRPGPRRPA